MSDTDESPEFPIADNEAIYDEQIAPLMTQILDICKAHGIPMVASFEYAPDDLCSSFILPLGTTGNLIRASEVIKPSSGLMAFTITKD